jgi:hypothetical protein
MMLTRNILRQIKLFMVGKTVAQCDNTVHTHIMADETLRGRKTLAQCNITIHTSWCHCHISLWHLKAQSGWIWKLRRVKLTNETEVTELSFNHCHNNYNRAILNNLDVMAVEVQLYYSLSQGFTGNMKLCYYQQSLRYHSYSNKPYTINYGLIKIHNSINNTTQLSTSNNVLNISHTKSWQTLSSVLKQPH